MRAGRLRLRTGLLLPGETLSSLPVLAGVIGDDTEGLDLDFLRDPDFDSVLSALAWLPGLGTLLDEAELAGDRSRLDGGTAADLVDRRVDRRTATNFF